MKIDKKKQYIVLKATKIYKKQKVKKKKKFKKNRNISILINLLEIYYYKEYISERIQNFLKYYNLKKDFIL